MSTSPGRPERELNHRLNVSHTGCMISDWVRAQATGFAAVQGRIVRCWSGVEMAVHDGKGLPGFGGAEVPCLQLWALRAVTADDAAVGITTYQDDDLFGLAIAPGVGFDGDLGRGYRLRTLTELPTGTVDDVAVLLDRDVIAEVHLQLGDRHLFLVAGEVHEDQTGAFVWHRLDESVLAFTDPDALARMSWMPTRGPLRHIA